MCLHFYALLLIFHLKLMCNFLIYKLLQSYSVTQSRKMWLLIVIFNLEMFDIIVKVPILSYEILRWVSWPMQIAFPITIFFMPEITEKISFFYSMILSRNPSIINFSILPPRIILLRVINLHFQLHFY